MSPETLQTLGAFAIGLGFLLIGLGGFSTYHASQQLQHQAELRQLQQKGDMDTQILTLLLKNQQLQDAQTQGKTAQEQAAPLPATAPPIAYYRPPSPPPPRAYTAAAPTYATPPPVAEAPVPAEENPSPAAEPDPGPAPEISPLPPGESAPEPPEARLDSMEPPEVSDWHEPDSLQPEVPMRYLSVRQQHVIADTLRAHGRHIVAVEFSYGDPVSKEFAQELAAAFTEADWVVTGITEHRGLPLASGVTVSAASFPPQQETRAVYEALLSAGIAVTQQLDPKQYNSETVVLVGAPL